MMIQTFQRSIRRLPQMTKMIKRLVIMGGNLEVFTIDLGLSYVDHMFSRCSSSWLSRIEIALAPNCSGTPKCSKHQTSKASRRGLSFHRARIFRLDGTVAIVLIFKSFDSWDHHQVYLAPSSKGVALGFTKKREASTRKSVTGPLVVVLHQISSVAQSMGHRRNATISQHRAEQA